MTFLLKSVAGPVDRFSEQYFQSGQLALVTCQQTLLCWRVSAVCIFVVSDIKSVVTMATLVTVSGGRWWSNAAPYPHSYQSRSPAPAHQPPPRSQLTHPGLQPPDMPGAKFNTFPVFCKSFLCFTDFLSVYFYCCLSACCFNMKMLQPHHCRLFSVVPQID